MDSPALLLIGAFAFAALIAVAVAHDRRNKLVEAGWLTLRRAGKAKLLGASGVPLGDWGWAYLPVRFTGEGHIMTVAPPGSGKSTTASIPSCLSRSIKSRFVADPGGEITCVCIREWRRQCDDIFVINPFALYPDAPYSLPQHAFDPMSFIDIGKQGSGRVARAIATALIAESGNDDAQSAYFKSQGADKLESYIVYGSLQGMTLPQIYDLMTLPVDARSSGDEIACQLELWEDMQQIDALDGQLRKEASDLIDKYVNSPGEFQAIFSTMRDALKFLKEPKIRQALARAEVDWTALKRERTAIAIVLPVADWKNYAGFVRLAFMSAMVTLQEGEVSPHRVHILLEEFPALGRLSFFADLLATSRKRNAQIEIVMQNLGQLMTTYPDWKAIAPNFAVTRFKAVDNNEEAEWIRVGLGSKYKRNPMGGKILTGLMTAREVREMPDDRQIVMIGRNRPAMLGQYPYWQKVKHRVRALPNPHYPGYPELGPLVPARYAAGFALRLWERIIRLDALVICALLSVLIWTSDPAVLTGQTYNSRTGERTCSWLSYRGVTTNSFVTSDSCAEFAIFGFLYTSTYGWIGG